MQRLHVLVLHRAPGVPMLIPFSVSNYIAWRLSNSNADLDGDSGEMLSVAFNAWGDPASSTFTLGVSWFNEETHERGEHSFTVTVTEDS